MRPAEHTPIATLAAAATVLAFVLWAAALGGRPESLYAPAPGQTRPAAAAGLAHSGAHLLGLDRRSR
jgi:hypothetical protein